MGLEESGRGGEWGEVESGRGGEWERKRARSAREIFSKFCSLRSQNFEKISREHPVLLVTKGRRVLGGL